MRKKKRWLLIILLILAAVVLMYNEYVLPPNDTNSITTAATGTIGETITIASWNLQIFGQTKASNGELMAYYADKIDDYDIIIIQEIRDSEETAFPKLCALLPDYNCVASSRAGRSSSKEQYGIIVRKELEIIGYTDYNLLGVTEYERPPVEVTFDLGSYDLNLWTIHVKPDDVKAELGALEGLIENSGFTVLLGDLNADCSYYKPEAEQEFDEWTWTIPDSADTTVASTNCAYDRIIVSDGLEDKIVQYGIDSSITEEASDHYLVWVELKK